MKKAVVLAVATATVVIGCGSPVAPAPALRPQSDTVALGWSVDHAALAPTTTAAPVPQSAAVPAAQKPVARPVAKPAPVLPVEKSQSVPAKPAAPAANFEQRLASAVAQVPGAGSTRWVPHAHPKTGAWGTTDFATEIVYVSPRTPAGHLLDVVRHEWMHVRQARMYGNSLAAANRALGSAEINADCGARLLGARWTNYTSRCSAEQTRLARYVLNGG